ncbi:hypothetical protein [Georgenia sp. SUBG003]|uniref:8-oxoguanine DNA glycosylase OGG fold protein n=1 Tax=Georgenia sp. SUBG003 TaxID=1497974 RepID=UPI003AB81ED0
MLEPDDLRVVEQCQYLYFAGAGRPAHPCLIVDARVMTTLYRELKWPWFANPRKAFGPKTYEVAMRVLSTWAERLSTEERVVAPDEVERWAFAVGK